MLNELTPEENKDRHVIERCVGFSLRSSYITDLMILARAMTEITTIMAVVNLRACSSVAVTVTDPIKLLPVLISSILQIKGFSGVFKQLTIKSI